MLFFTADTHFNHTNIIKYCKRPFTNVSEMNETMIDNWNHVVSESDIVYVIGDFGMGNCRSIFNELKGRKILVIGSHDRSCEELFSIRSPMIEVNLGNRLSVTLCHYCLRVWPKSHYNSWHLYGHSHGKLSSIGKSYDVGVDSNNFTPVSLNQITEIMKSRPDNPNLLR